MRTNQPKASHGGARCRKEEKAGGGGGEPHVMFMSVIQYSLWPGQARQKTDGRDDQLWYTDTRYASLDEVRTRLKPEFQSDLSRFFAGRRIKIHQSRVTCCCGSTKSCRSRRDQLSPARHSVAMRATTYVQIMKRNESHN